MTRYQTHILNLFDIAVDCNAADSNQPADWTVTNDAFSTSTFGAIKTAIVQLAGEAIFNHWIETNNVDLDLAEHSQQF